MSIQELKSSIEQDRQRAIAAGLRVPEMPRCNSWTSSHQYFGQLESFRDLDLARVLRRIGQPPMQKPKLVKATAGVRDSYRGGDVVADGFRFSLPQYPGVDWFVFQQHKSWRVVEWRTGISAGGGRGSTRTAAIEEQWDALENMRMAPRHGGSAKSVTDYITQLAIAQPRRNQ